MNHYDPETGIKIEPIEINKDLLSLFNRILDQNEMILRSNEKMLEALGAPRFLYHQPDAIKASAYFKGNK